MKLNFGDNSIYPGSKLMQNKFHIFEYIQESFEVFKFFFRNFAHASSKLSSTSISHLNIYQHELLSGKGIKYEVLQKLIHHFNKNLFIRQKLIFVSKIFKVTIFDEDNIKLFFTIFEMKYFEYKAEKYLKRNENNYYGG